MHTSIKNCERDLLCEILSSRLYLNEDAIPCMTPLHPRHVAAHQNTVQELGLDDSHQFIIEFR